MTSVNWNDIYYYCVSFYSILQKYRSGFSTAPMRPNNESCGNVSSGKESYSKAIASVESSDKIESNSVPLHRESESREETHDAKKTATPTTSRQSSGVESGKEHIARSYSIEEPELPDDKRLALSMKKRSEKVDERPPAIYKLPVKDVRVDQKKMIAIKEVGQPRVDAPPPGVVVIMVGATGAGKTTLINGIANYILGVSWTDDFRFQLVTHDDEGEESEAYSRTKWISVYTFNKMDGSRLPYTLSIIDTPGFGDTRGINQDKKISGLIRDLFSVSPKEYGIDEITAVGVVTQATVARLTPTQKYIFDSVLSIFREDISGNIFLMTTFADGGPIPVIDAARSAGVPFQSAFKFNNSALFAKKHDESDEDEDEDDINNMFWKMGMKNFCDFFSVLEKRKPKSLQLSKEVLQDRERFTAIAEGVKPSISVGLDKLAELEQELSVVEENKSSVDTNEPFNYTVKVTKQSQQTLPPGKLVTNCHRCKFTCHYPCRVAENERKQECIIMYGSGVCHVCPQRCHAEQHCSDDFYYDLHMEEETRSLEYLNMHYYNADAANRLSRSDNIVGNIWKRKEHVEKRIFAFIFYAHDSLKQIAEKAMKPPPDSADTYIDMLVMKEKHDAKEGFEKRLKYLDYLKQNCLTEYEGKNDSWWTKLLTPVDNPSQTKWEAKGWIFQQFDV